jgi:quinol monooxygenase YgiN
MAAERRVRWSIRTVVGMTALCAGTLAASEIEHDRVQAASLVELRQYVTYPGRRDELISLFEDHFVESQEELGMLILGTFREPEHPSHFTWLRAFSDMESRAKSLNEFYSGPVWGAYGKAANPTMEDSDNVLLLREAYPGSGFAPPASPREPIGSSARPAGLVVVNIYYLKSEPRAGFIDFFKREISPELNRAKTQVLAALVPESTPNNYPKLKVREGENLFVWVARFEDAADYQRHLAVLEKQPRWRDHVAPKLDAELDSPPEVLKLQPTARSLLR